MRSTESAGRFRFGSVRFDERSGEIERLDGQRPVTVRLPPQPARLLAHLIRHRPELVSGDEIRRLLWPDVRVEYEQSLHTCIRQIRSALGDAAAAPRYIETIPRRGYRFLVEAEELAASGSGEAAIAATGQPAGRGRERRRLAPGLASTLILTLLLALSLGAASLRFGAAARSPTRVAVMPFEPSVAGSPLAPGNGLAEAIVERLVAPGARPLAIVGPTTTEAYAGRSGGLRDLIDDLGLDYVVNGRETAGAPGARVLVEIIRADGAHLWARYLDELPPDEEAAHTIARALRSQLP